MSDSQNIPEMRDTIERLSKEKAALTQEVGSLSQELRVRDARDAFAAAGYAKSHGDLFVASNPEAEITAETVVAFADQFGLPTVASGESSTDGDSASSQQEDQSGLTSMAGGGSRSGDTGAGGAQVESLTREQWKQLHATDPSAAAAAIASGRVEISRDNPFVKNSGLPRGTNPYALASDDS